LIGESAIDHSAFRVNPNANGKFHRASRPIRSDRSLSGQSPNLPQCPECRLFARSTAETSEKAFEKADFWGTSRFRLISSRFRAPQTTLTIPVVHVSGGRWTNGNWSLWRRSVYRGNLGRRLKQELWVDAGVMPADAEPQVRSGSAARRSLPAQCLALPDFLPGLNLDI